MQFVTFTLLLLLTMSQIVASVFPSNEYVYSFSRDVLLDAERKFEQRTKPFSREEETVSHYLQYLKWREFVRTKDSGFPPSRPLEEMLSSITSSEIYKALVKLPKGGNMHSHENHEVGKKMLLDIVWDSPDFQYVHMLPPNHPIHPWMLDFFVTPPHSEPPWINVKASNTYTKEDILKHQTFIGILSSNATKYSADSGMHWKEMNVLWARSSDMISNLNIKKKYIQAMYEKGLEQGVIYFETRKNLYEEVYVLDPSPEYNSTYGRRYLNPMGDDEIELILELVHNFSQLHPEFVGHKRISSARRKSTMKKLDFYLENVIRLRGKYPDHVMGFDIVGEEDAGYAHLHYLSEFLKLFNSSTGKMRIPLYLHAAETNWPDDLMASSLNHDPLISQFDPVSSLMNSYEAILLSASRLGHGYGFIKHPYLLSLLKERQIPMEICIVSNQLLGFTPDIRNHPGLHYYRYGIPVVLGSDDAGTFGYENFTVDWYEVFMAWGLDLQDLKTLALNSFKYSALSDVEKKAAIEHKWRPMWDRYVANMSNEACSRDFRKEAIKENRATTFATILPSKGARTGSTKVHILGRNFELGICRNIVCLFGDLESPSTTYISNQHIICESPDFGDGQERSVEVSVLFGDDILIPTGFTFTYQYEPIVIPLPQATTSPTEPATSSSSRFQNFCRLVSFLLVIRHWFDILN